MEERKFIDIYCERTGPEFWAEPINAITNLSFIFASVFIVAQIYRQNLRDTHLTILVGLIGMIGIGSFLFHTKAVYWAMLADVIPIMIFQLYFLYVYSRWALGWGLASAFALPAVFVVLTAGFEFLPRDWLNGSIGYAPSILLLIIVAINHFRQGLPGGKYFLAAAFIFPASLTFRTLDEWLCASIPSGTHFLWHVLNGVVLFLLVQVLIHCKKPERRI